MWPRRTSSRRIPTSAITMTGVGLDLRFFRLIVAVGAGDLLDRIRRLFGRDHIVSLPPYPSGRKIGAPAHRPGQMV
ncbi:hypothetical protein [Mycobacterium sp.]|uniref:hypothetical protein n=1 Tax=Mycobacterium sp. TaxID=1785 RepID=UPI002B635FB8|nr:hypothetical protein [Mycobacterium sp.]HKP44718.1 hypothetical protein [Mycobacterium sp.]